MGWELHAGEGSEAPEPWVSKSVKLHAGILSPSSSSNPERLMVTPQGVLSLLSHTYIHSQLRPSAGCDSHSFEHHLPWVTSKRAGSASLQLQAYSSFQISLSFSFYLNSHFLCAIMPSPGNPSIPQPTLLLCVAPQGQPLPLAQLSYTVLSTLPVPPDGQALLLFWPKRKLTSLLYPPVSMAQNPQDFSLWMVHVLGHACVTRVPISPWMPPCLVHSVTPWMGPLSTSWQSQEPVSSWPCLLACCSISLAQTLQWPSGSTLHLKSLLSTLKL